MASKETPSKGGWLRRVVPPGYATAVLKFVGTAPLLMNSGEVDRDSALYRAYYLLGQKKRRTLEDDANLRKMEWELRLYFDAELGPFVPGKNVKELLRSAATKWRRGEDIKRSLIVVPYRVPLIYDGPRDQEGLWEAGFRYTAMVSNAGIGSGRVLRCRPMFDHWSADVDLAYDPEEIDADFLSITVDRSEKYGLGDYRPEFGSFVATLAGPAFHRKSRAGLATKIRNAVEEAAHEAFKDRIIVETGI